MNTKMQLDEQELMNAETQIARVFRALRGCEWATLPEIHEVTGDAIPSVSAQLRAVRAAGFPVNRRLRRRGLYEYSLQRAEGGHNVSADA